MKVAILDPKVILVRRSDGILRIDATHAVSELDSDNFITSLIDQMDAISILGVI